MNHPISLTAEQVDIINSSLERATAVLDLLVGCGPDEMPRKDMPESASLTVLFQMTMDELNKIEGVMQVVGAVE